MAFSTQKDFFNVPFMNESFELDCKKACVKLKRYESAIDSRSWAHDETTQSKFLSDLVTCEYPASVGAEGDFNKRDRQTTSMGGIKRSPESAPRSANTSEYIGKSKFLQNDESENKEGLATNLGNLSGGDSLLERSNVRLAEYQKILRKNTALENQFEISNEHLISSQGDNKKIQEILSKKLDSNMAKNFYNKIQKFTAAGKLDKNEENEMLQIYQQMENLYKAYEILQDENNRLLKKVEDNYHTIKQQQSNNLSSISEQDAENIKAIINERNSLREKFKYFKGLEQQVTHLEYKAEEAKNEAKELSSSLINEKQYIKKMEGEIQNMQKYYEEKIQNACLAEECLKAQLQDLKDEVVKVKCEAQKAEMLAMEVSCLRNEILKRDLVIKEYDCQYNQLMGVIEELKSAKLQCLNDNETQTCKYQTDELAFYTCATLEEILKELERRGCLDNEIMGVYALEPAPADKTKDECDPHCCQEMEHLKQQINEMKKQIREESNCEEICRDALERLKEVEYENAQLLHDNQAAKEKLKEGEVTLANMLKKIEKMDTDINKNEQEANKIGKDLEGTIGLVKDISDVQFKNQQLASAVSAINSRDDQKIIDDLRRQLNEELAKLRKCQQDNANLLKEAKEREMDLKDLKELNNKLQADNDRLKDNINLNQPDATEKRGDVKYGDTSEIMRHADSNLSFTHPKAKDTRSDKEISELMRHSTHMIPLKGDDSQEKSKTTPNLHPDAASNQLQPRRNHQKFGEFTDSDGFTTSTSKDAASIKPKRSQQSAKYVSDREKTSIKDSAGPQISHDKQKNKLSDDYVVPSPHKDVNAKQFVSDRRKNATLDDFVTRKSDTLKFNLQKDRCFEKEFRKILEEFISECSNCFCRLYNAKSKLYTICHKLCHSGIDRLNFQELAYIHKKIYSQADQLLPGCLLDMILSEHREQVERILTSVVMPRLAHSKAFDHDDQKCCCCKSELCCNNSEEMLKDKVNKLEKDIGIAREYLESLRSIPLADNINTDNGDSTDTNNSTYRASSAVMNQQKPRYLRHVKNLKARNRK